MKEYTYEIERDGKLYGGSVWAKSWDDAEKRCPRNGKVTGELVYTMDLAKRKIANDVFSTEAEAISRSYDMGLDGVIHPYEYEGQAYFMPGESHKAYMEYYGQAPEEQDDTMERAIRAVVAEIMNKNVEGQILKVDDEQHIIYGWASVATEKGEPVVDLQGDVIEMSTLEKAVNDFMEHVRVGKTMHVGEQTGMVIHSMPVSNDIAKALGIQSDREGWIVGYKVYDEDVWKMVKSGELRAFSIGGRAIKEEYNG